jgi:hypothetical protein
MVRAQIKVACLYGSAANITSLRPKSRLSDMIQLATRWSYSRFEWPFMLCHSNGLRDMRDPALGLMMLMLFGTSVKKWIRSQRCHARFMMGVHMRLTSHLCVRHGCIAHAVGPPRPNMAPARQRPSAAGAAAGAGAQQAADAEHGVAGGPSHAREAGCDLA